MQSLDKNRLFTFEITYNFVDQCFPNKYFENI
jgi:hypothetical protein